MWCVLFWLGVAVAVIGLGQTLFYPGWFAYGGGLSLGGMIICVGVVLVFAFVPTGNGFSPPLPTDPRPVALALAFEDDTPPADRQRGNLRPGLANEHLARWLDERADSFSVIVAQEAILRVWFGTDFRDGQPLHGTPVYRMHRHDGGRPVRTLEAVACAVERLHDCPPKAIVLVAHDKHFPRAAADLRAVYRGQVIDPGIRRVPYRNRNPLLPVAWAVRELAVARPLDFVQRTAFAGTACRCRESSRAGLGPIPWSRSP